MTLGGRLATLFPAAHLGLSALGPILAIREGRPSWLLLGLLVLYLFPPLCHRLHNVLWPLREGHANLSQPRYSPWWTSLEMQAAFNAMPWLEGVLRLAPGMYSCWLRLWGSRIGRGVVWTPRVEIADRTLLDVGDHVVFGHRVALYPHVVDRRQDGDIFLYVKRIRIGDRAFIGAGSRLGPGASVAADARLPALTDVFINQRFGDS